MTPFAKLQNERQAAGLCRACGKPRDSGNSRLCAVHHDRDLATLKTRRMKRIVAGVCMNGCGAPIFKGGKCEPHYAAQREAVIRCRANQRARGAAQVPEGAELGGEA